VVAAAKGCIALGTDLGGNHGIAPAAMMMPTIYSSNQNFDKKLKQKP
jgi:hypothetical protein